MYYKLISFNSNENSKKGNQQNDAIKCITNIVKQKIRKNKTKSKKSLINRFNEKPLKI